MIHHSYFLHKFSIRPPKRCQEWTMEFVRHLIAKGLIAADAIQIVQSKHDPPTHGIGLQPV